QEVTTEGGLDVIRNKKRIFDVSKKFSHKKIILSLFIDPVKEQIVTTNNLGIGTIELHTGAYANAREEKHRDREYGKLLKAIAYAKSLGLIVNLGHGLTYQNIAPLAKLEDVHEFNIGHSIISRAVFTGMEKAVKDMLELL
ncbi:pyridoxine 5'-phosphate synthase, partial [Spirochaetota bacterium]